jgi:excisionase family DNA binding protein
MIVEQERLLTTAEVAAVLRMQTESVRALIRKGEIRAVRFGDRTGLRIRQRDLDAFIESRLTPEPKGTTPA